MLLNLTDKINGNKEIDLLITDAKVFNVFTMEFMEVDVMVDLGMIIGFGQVPAKQIINANGKYLLPGLIDGHMHIESTMLTPIEYSKIALANGVTTVFADCHEIANVLGKNGIDYMLCEVEKAYMDINVMLPSSVPCSKVSNDNIELTAKDLVGYYSDPFVYGLAELMDFERVENWDEDYIQKMRDCTRRNLTIDGHMAGLNPKQVDLLRSYKVATDHECETKQELLERLSRGVKVQIREGSAAKNFTELMSAVTVANNSQISFCTDDISIVDLVEKGSINNIIKKGISEGYAPELLIKMATFNAARAYNLTDKGAIAPGYVADLLLVDDLEQFKIEKVFKDGLVMNDKIDFTINNDEVDTDITTNSVNISIDEKTIDLTPKHDIAIEVSNGSLVTGKATVSVSERDNLSKIVVLNRYGKDSYFVSYIKGIDLSDGVIASSISHDYHNIVIIGHDDDQIRKMIKYIKNSNGGVYTLFNGQIDDLKLDVAGLMSSESINETYISFKRLLDTVDFIDFDEPFLAMSFLTLDVIPFLKITDRGLYDFETHILLD
ncbi:adenine deaminase C-terminal domain-containing protein [Mollicutes bacterium LVI A0078]|nr:adenine deaminase C-terminal domain-containing protein [Mollicutes bacterium LVI A0075]WOO90225.1 adenine deaminase C-terminal domain-containing protein [Mollicutes bacterium LVI A0078]